MSSRHQSRRRRVYGRRQHELRERSVPVSCDADRWEDSGGMTDTDAEESHPTMLQAFRDRGAWRLDPPSRWSTGKS